MSKTTSNAILHLDELKEHFSDETNHYLYKKQDDGTIVAWMCCDFEWADDNGNITRGGCGDGINYDPKNKTISVQRGI